MIYGYVAGDSLYNIQNDGSLVYDQLKLRIFVFFHNLRMSVLYLPCSTSLFLQ